MIFPGLGLTNWTAELVNHLWQSTVFAGGVWLLTLVLRHNHAHTRHRLWVLASAKFLLPLSLLMPAGGMMMKLPPPGDDADAEELRASNKMPGTLRQQECGCVLSVYSS